MVRSAEDLGVKWFGIENVGELEAQLAVE